ncbi:hypothetical protein DLAC_09908 [Tieghemostelium lacteum]|uniref:EGF-like domain-containing protein n=1 Tax=Tieghemostelium lacteum TaxID=361077 RepID=A0A151Z5K8_TIELA|nr:hypothetical protein DLAC_09908 [Tieghemostelium lacteum]|eukprot:KYQ89252.1 hypothetical protein DLAC_09908 [Tieghemostelium lacteum]
MGLIRSCFDGITTIKDISEQTPTFRYLNNFYAESDTSCVKRQYLVLIQDGYDLANMTMKSPVTESYSLSYEIIIRNVTTYMVKLTFQGIPIGSGFLHFSVTNSLGVESAFNSILAYRCELMPYPLDLEPLNNGYSVMSKDEVIGSVALFRINNWDPDYGIYFDVMDITCDQGLSCFYGATLYRSYPNNIFGIEFTLRNPYLYEKQQFKLSIRHEDGVRYSNSTFTVPQLVIDDGSYTQYSGFTCYPQSGVIYNSRHQCEITVTNGTSLVYLDSLADQLSTYKRQRVYGTPQSYTILSYHNFNRETSDSLFFTRISANNTQPVSAQSIATYSESNAYTPPFYPANDQIPFLDFTGMNVAPKLESIEFIPWGPIKVIIRMHITSYGGPGFSAVGPIMMYSSDLYQGNNTDGFYEMIVEYSYLQQYINPNLTIYDWRGQSYKKSFFYYENTNLVKTPYFPAIQEGKDVFGLKNITRFFYKNNNVIIGKSPVNNTLYIELSNPDPNIAIEMKIFYHNNDISSAEIVYGYWDPDLQLFAVDFTLKGGLFTDTAFSFFLTIGFFFTKSTELGVWFPQTGVLNVINSNADEYPPIVSAWEPLGLGSLTIANLDVIVQFGFRITIDDPINGFDYGNLTIAGLKDPGFVFTFTPQFADKGNQTSGEYVFIMELSGYCKSDTYAIREINLVDKGGWLSTSNNYHYVHPLMKFLDGDYPTITVTCTAGDALNDTVPPTVLQIDVPTSIDVGSLNRTLTITFVAQDATSGIKNLSPLVNIYNVDGSVAFQRNAKPLPDLIFFNNVTFQVSTELPYGFGYPYGIFYQIEGIADNSLNFLSLSNDDITSKGFQNVINVEYSMVPWINGHEPISTSGGELTIYGRSFATGSSRVVNIKYGSQPYKKVPVKYITNVAMILSNVPGSLDVFYVQIVRENTMKSNEYPITPFILPTQEPSPTLTTTGAPENLCDEDKTCSGNGQCTLSGCVCNSPWIGKYCSSQVINVPVTPSPNVTEPTVVINGTGPDGDEINFSTLVNIISVRELSPNQTVVFEYKFNQWIYTNITDDFGEQFLYDSNFTKDGVTTDISITIQWFKTETTIIFANQNITINPSTMKYKINVSPFKFSSSLNSFQIVMAATVMSDSTKDSCSAKEFGETSDPNYQYAKLQIDKISLYGKFIKLGVVDGRVVNINNILLDSEKSEVLEASSSFTQSFIGITAPNFKRFLKLDPDFSVLLDTSSASEDPNSVCQIKEDGGLTKSQLAGMIIGIVGFSLVAVAVAIYYILKNQKDKRMIKLLNNRIQGFNETK